MKCIPDLQFICIYNEYYIINIILSIYTMYKLLLFLDYGYFAIL